MKLIWHGAEDGEKVGVDPGVLDLHGRPLVPPSLVAPDSEKAKFVIEAGKSFYLDHTNARVQVVCDWMRSHDKFQCLDRDVLPSSTRAGIGNTR